MAAMGLALSDKGKRKYTQGWAGAKHVKRTTSKLARRLAKQAIRRDDGEPMHPAKKGWAW